MTPDGVLYQNEVVKEHSEVQAKNHIRVKDSMGRIWTVPKNILKKTNEMGICLRPLWRPLNKLPMYQNSQKGDLTNSEILYDRVICLPSSPQLIL